MITIAHMLTMTHMMRYDIHDNNDHMLTMTHMMRYDTHDNNDTHVNNDIHDEIWHTC